MEDTTKRIGIGAAIGLGVGVVLGAPALGVVALGALGAGGGKAYDVYKGLPGTSGGGGGGSGGGYVPPKDEPKTDPTGRAYVAPPDGDVDTTRVSDSMAGTRSKGAPVFTIAKDYFKKKFGGTDDYPSAVADAPLGAATVPGDADKTIDQLPDGADSPTSESSWAPYGLRTGVRDMIASPKWVHDPPGWLGTGSTPGAPAYVFGRLRALGYKRAADQVIWTYLHTSGDETKGGSPAFGGGAGGGIDL